jgi:hypothetical protein
MVEAEHAQEAAEKYLASRFGKSKIMVSSGSVVTPATVEAEQIIQGDWTPIVSVKP